jgi:hypothetical protein
MRLDYELTRKWILKQTRMKNCKENVQIENFYCNRVHISSLVKNIFLHACAHIKIIRDKYEHKGETPKSADTHAYLQINKHMDKYVYFETNLMNYSTCSLSCFVIITFSDQPHGLMVGVSDYWSWGPGFDSRFYHGDFSVKGKIPMMSMVWVV